MSEINEKKNNEKEEDEFDIKKIILISIISIGIIIILYYLSRQDMLEKLWQAIGVIQPVEADDVNTVTWRGKTIWPGHEGVVWGGRKNITKYY